MQAIFEKKVAIVKRKTAHQGSVRIFMGFTAILLLVFGLSIYSTPASARAVLAAPLCGDGSAPDYGLSYDMQQEHWTVGWQNYASQQAVTQVDTVFDRLDAGSVAQTMILILPQEQVGNRVNCAVHFLRYMQLGLTSGARKDNGFVFLIVVEPDAIDVHYGVGLGLPALTASELTDLNRAAEAAYQSGHNMDQALLALADGFDTLASSKYPPLISPTPGTDPTSQAQLPTTPLGILTLCGQLCFGLLFLLLLIFGGPFLARRGIYLNPGGFGSGDRGFPFGGGGGRGRGGSGSGRSGRGN